MCRYMGFLAISCLVFGLNAESMVDSAGIDQKDTIGTVKSKAILQIKDLKVDQNNNVDVFFTANIRNSDFSEFKIEIFRAIEDGEGKIEGWEKDMNAFVVLFYPNEAGNGVFVSKLKWVAASPENPSNSFKIVLKNKNGKTADKTFKVNKPNR